MIFKSWKTDLEKVLPRLRQVALGGHPIKVVAVNDRVALGLPPDGNFASEVVKLYRPMKRKARLFTHLLDLISRTGILRLLVSKKTAAPVPEISWLQENSALGFLGCNPAHGIRCVVLSPGSEGSLRVTKVAIGGSLDPVIAEARKLQAAGKRYRGVVGFGGMESGEGWTAFWTEYIAGRGPRSVVDAGILELLDGWISPGRSKLGDLPWVISLCQSLPSKVGENLRNLEICKALVHGDFAPWNLRRGIEGLVAIDWERAREDGVGGLDLGYGLIMESMLVRGLSGKDLIDEVLSVARSDGFAAYLQKCGWVDETLWVLLSLLYAGHEAGQKIDHELEVLKNMLEQSQTI